MLTLCINDHDLFISLIVGLEGGNIGVVFLCQNEKQENHIADCDIVVRSSDLI